MTCNTLVLQETFQYAKWRPHYHPIASAIIF